MQQQRIKFQDFSGVEVFIDQDGGFCAELNDRHFNRPTFESLKIAIEEEKKIEAKALKLQLPCIALIRDEEKGPYSVEPLTLEGVSRSDSSLKWTERANKGVRFAVPASPQNRELLTALAKAKFAVERIEAIIEPRAIRSSHWGGRIKPSDYLEAINRLTAAWERASNAETA